MLIFQAKIANNIFRFISSPVFDMTFTLDWCCSYKIFTAFQNYSAAHQQKDTKLTLLQSLSHFSFPRRGGGGVNMLLPGLRAG